MKCAALSGAVVLGLVVCASGQAAVTFSWATVGNAGNAADSTTFGAVSYEFKISKHEVTNAQYTEFLNAADPAGDNWYGLYNANMTVEDTGGIAFNAAAGSGAKYSSKAGMATKPVVYVCWYDVARFVNWLHNGQGSGSTETGVYDMSQPSVTTRSANADYVIPTEDEWYKAAYHKNDGVTGNYWLYPTATDSEPSNDLLTPDGGNNANFSQDGSTVGYPTFLTDVGEFENSQSPYGTFDQGGNVVEWNETLVAAGKRGARGGSWGLSSVYLTSTHRDYLTDTSERYLAGFRVASVPEPALGFVALASAPLLLKRRRAR